MLEITTFRAEVYLPDSRKPEVVFSDDIETDLSRRDFTMNAIAQAEDAGVPRVLARRVERALAHLVADRAWYDTATRRLLETDLDDVERVGLELESWRGALLAGQGTLADERLTNLDATRAGRRGTPSREDARRSSRSGAWPEDSR